MPSTRIKNRATEEGSPCEMQGTLEGVPCRFPGEIHYRGLLLCGPHAQQLEAGDSALLLQGIVSTLDLCLKSLSLRRNAELLETLKFERAEAAQELAQAKKDLWSAESENLV